MKPVIKRIASDCDLRNRFLRQFPKLLDPYFLSGGEILTEDEMNKKSAFNYFLNGMDFVSDQIRRI